MRNSRVCFYLDRDEFLPLVVSLPIYLDLERNWFVVSVGKVEHAMIVSGKEIGITGSLFGNRITKPDRTSPDDGSQIIEAFRCDEPEIGIRLQRSSVLGFEGASVQELSGCRIITPDDELVAPSTEISHHL